MNERTKRIERMMTEQFITLKGMNERTARRFRLTAREHGFTVASLLNDFNPVPHAACSRHLSLCDRYRNDDEMWRAHMEMAEYFCMIQKNN